MAYTVEIDTAIIEALKASSTYRLRDRSGAYLAVQNPWKAPVELQNAGATAASLAHADDWLAVSEEFFGVSQLEVYSDAQWQELIQVPEPEENIDWNAPPQGFASPAEAPHYNDQYYDAPYTPPLSPPGQGLAITGIVLIFFAPVIGLIFSIIARSKAVKAGTTQPLAIVGIVVNAVLTGVIAIIVLLITISSITTQNAYEDIANDDYSYNEPPTYEIPETNEHTAPSWWISSNDEILEIANKVQPTFEASSINTSCNADQYIESSYAVYPDTLPDPAKLAEDYRVAFQAAYPDRQVLVTPLYSPAGTYEVNVSGSNDDEAYADAPSATLQVSDTFTALTVASSCDQPPVSTTY
jgi:hypothetical protein